MLHIRASPMVVDQACLGRRRHQILYSKVQCSKGDVGGVGWVAKVNVG